MSEQEQPNILDPANVQHVPAVEAVNNASGSVANVRLPDFWAHDPIMWFKQREAAFRRGNVTSSLVKYDYVLMRLPQSVVQAVRDLIQAVDDATPDASEQLKTRLVGSFGQSKWQQANMLIDHPGVGDTH
jgi:hypothetical protein